MDNHEVKAICRNILKDELSISHSVDEDGDIHFCIKLNDDVICEEWLNLTHKKGQHE